MTGVALAWPSTSCVIKAKVGRCYYRQISRQDVVMVINVDSGDFPAGPVVKTLCVQCRGPRFNPWSGN